MSVQKLLEDVIELAKEIDKGDPIDFGMLNVTEDAVYATIASQLIEKNEETPEEYRELMMLASCTHLVVQNMVLNMQLYKSGM